MKETLISLGFKMVKSCSCSGTYAETYKKNLTSVEIKPMRNVWSLKINGVFQTKGNKDNLTEKLTEYAAI